MWLVGFPNCLTLENGDTLPLGVLVTWMASPTHPISVREDKTGSSRVLEPLGLAESAVKSGCCRAGEERSCPLCSGRWLRFL